jgi:hypothetical protein
MDVSTYRDLADRLRAYGLSTAAKGAHLRVVHPLSTTSVEEIVGQGGRHVIAWGHEIGERGDETGTALRPAHLLGAPPGATV